MAVDEKIATSTADVETAVAAERKRMKARAIEVVGWHRTGYNEVQINQVIADLERAL